MKSRFCILLIACLFASPIFAEKTGNALLNYGARLGAGVNSVVSDAKRDIYPEIVGLGGELSFDVMYKISQSFFLHSALGVEYRDFRAYDEGGVSLDCGPNCGGSWEGYDVNSFVYLDIPVMVQWRIPRILYLEAGAFANILLFAHEEYAWPERFRTPRCYDDKRFGAGIVTGLGHEFSSGLFMDFRVSFQLTDLVSGDKEGHTEVEEEREMREENGEYHTRVLWRNENYVGGSYYKLLKIQLGIGYWF